MYRFLSSCYLHFRQCVFGVLLFVFTSAAFAGGGTTTLNFSATFIAASCDVTVDRANIAFVPAAYSQIAASGATGFDPQNFAIQFSNCQGVGATPKIQVKGATFTAGIPLFRDPSGVSGYSQGYGVQLVKTGTIVPIANLDKLSVGLPTDDLSVSSPAPLQLTASLSCGTCTKSAVTAGTLKSVVTFQFLYE